MDYEISSEDEHLLREHRWRPDGNGYLARAEMVDGKRTTFFLHRVIANPPEGMHVDHIDGNPGNNCRENLRVCTHAENMRNRRISKSNKTGLKGVFKIKETGRFSSEIKCNGTKYRLGNFTTADEAYAAYCIAAARLHGEFARLN